ncbi:BREX-2 system phosphatase PglZ [Virgisporangium aurantiacum]|uniref:BREX-2 system phosphatase PglZ n=1 Tax=Virgisporangium aurantiacum TaxID=175570 RepID=UPI0019526B70|nr:BREX-2 system phosphatase PglZ [Virgisporangium aurantiacum]
MASSVAVAQPAAIRRKVEAWLDRSDDESVALALRATPVWDGEPVVSIGSVKVRIVPCPTPLAARAALHDRAEDERVVLLTDLSDAELGDGILAHVSQCTVRSVDPWEVVRQLFGGAALDPTLVRTGRWVCDALTDLAPATGWPRPAGTVITRDHALRSLVTAQLGIRPDQIDSAGLLQWTTDAAALLRFTGLPEPIADGLGGYLSDVVGPAAAPILAAVRAGHGTDVIPLGLLVGLLWPDPAPRPAQQTEIAVARVRLEARFGGRRLTDPEAKAFRTAAEAWTDRIADDPGSRGEAGRLHARAETLAADLEMTGLLGGSSILPSGFTHRMRDFAAAVRLAVSGSRPGADQVARAQDALALVEGHRAADTGRIGTARMALRLLRWLSAEDDPKPRTLHEALHRQVRVDGWVDRARLDIFAGDTDPAVAEAYRLLHRAVDTRRGRHDEQFATLLAASTKADEPPGTLLRVEDLLERIVRPVMKRGHRVLLLVMDGMSVAAATELAESVTSGGTWLELAPDGGPRTGVLAALPTVTDVSRCSLFSGRIAVGQQKQEIAALTARFPSAVLLHKGDLRAGAGAALAPDVVAALADETTPLVAAVVNTIDDALDRSEPGTVVWSTETVTAVRDLLALATGRVVIVVSDHGHVIDRGPDGVVRPSPSSENRWRPATPPPGDGEVLVTGSRVAAGDGAVVLPWREDIRYGPRKSGYHGGASAAEAVIPLLVFSAHDEKVLPGWSGAPVASPAWWREPVTAAAPAPAPVRRPASRPPQPAGDTLFDLAAEPAAAPAALPPSLVDRLLASDLYRQRRGTRAPLPDARVAALVAALLARGGRATLETLAAAAEVPAHRIRFTVTALQKLLQVEGYPVLELDPDGHTVKLDQDLLVEQFGLADDR